MKSRLSFILFCLIALTSCDLFKKQNPENVIAKVNEHILYKGEITEAMPENFTKEDSVFFVKSYIDKWAMDKIILDRAKFNLPLEEQQRFNKMVEQYKSELFKKAYLDALIQRELNDVVDSLEILEYYNNHKEIFKINEELLKIRYLYIKKSLKDYKQIKESFKRFEIDDQDYLMNEQLKFDKIKLNDSVWVKSTDVLTHLKDLNKDQQKYLQFENRYLEIQDSIGTYLIYVKNVLKPNSDAPISYIKPTIEQILRNKKKLEMKADLEKQILNDAIKNNNYEIFE